MSDDDTDDQERIDGAPDWEATGRELLALKLRVQSDPAYTEVLEVAEQVGNGDDPDPQTLRSARENLDMTIRLLEEHVGPTNGSAIHTEFDDGFGNGACTCLCRGTAD